MAELVNRQPVTALAAEFEHNLAVVIGINAYTYVRRLKTARPDAERLARLLQDQRRDLHDQYEVIALYDEEASSSALSTLLFETVPARVRQLGKRTRVLFYFAGHGDAETSEDELTVKGFLFPQDAEPEDESTLLPMDKVQDAVAGLDCQHVLLILDCCSAGALPKRPTTRSDRRLVTLYWDYLQRYVGRKARQVITSAAHNQQALDVDPRYKVGIRDEGDGGGYSPFAQALFEALDPGSEQVDPAQEAGRKGVVTATALCLYISEALYRRGLSQTPGLWTVAEKGHDQGEYVFLLPGTRLELEPAPDLSKDEYNPWPGLVAYNQDQAELFAGRDQVIQALTQRVEAQPLVVVTGPSSAGKTSLVQAGLLPWLEEKTKGEQGATAKRWRVLPALSLGEMPLSTLGQFLAAQLPETVMPTKAETFGRKIRDLAVMTATWLRNNPNQRLLLTLDTAEALFDEANKLQRDRLWPLLVNAAQQDGLHIVLTVRRDHWGEPFPLPAETRFELDPMNREELRQVVKQPADELMVDWESKELVDQLLDEAQDQPATLPLLSETLHRMYLHHAADARVGLCNDRTLTQTDYDAVGGVKGVLAELAETTYRELPDDVHRLTMQHVLMRLVDVTEGQYVRRRARQWEFVYPAPQATARARAVIIGLAERGLVVLGADAEGHSYVELGHTDLTKHWQRLRAWLLEEGVNWGLQRELTAQVVKWTPNRQKADLWNDNPKLSLVQTLAWPTEEKQQGLAGRLHRGWRVLVPKKETPASAGWLNQEEVHFVQASVNERAKFRQRLFGALTAFVVVLMVAIVVALVLRDLAVQAEATAVAKQAEAEREARRAKSGELAVYAQNAIANNKSDPSLALLLAIQAVEVTWRAPEKSVTTNAEKALRDAIDSAPPYIMTLPRNRHTDVVRSAGYSPDGQYIVTASNDGTARIWDAVTGQETQELVGHTGGVTSAAYSPNGQYIVTASGDRTARIWDAATGHEIRQLTGHTGEVTSAAYNPDGRYIVTSSDDGTARIWDAVTGQEIQKLVGHSCGVILNEILGELELCTVVSAVYSPDGQHIVTAGMDQTARIWDVATGQDIRWLTGHVGFVWSVAYGPDGQSIVTAGEDGTARIWDAATGQEIQKLVGHGCNVIQVCYVYSATYSPNGQYIVTSSADHTARVWDAVTGREIRQLAGHAGGVQSAAYSPDGRHIVTASDDGTARIWDAVTGQEVHDLSGLSSNSAAYSPDGERIVTTSLENVVRIWDAVTGQEIHQLTGHTDWVSSAAYSPNGRYIVTSSADHTARVWDSATGQEIRQLTGHTGIIRSAAYSPDGHYIVTASGDKTARIWDAATGQEIRQLTGHTGGVVSAAYSSDGYNIVTASVDKTARIWDAATGQEIRQLSGHTGWVWSAAYSPDGKHIVTASWDNTARVWDAVTGQEIRQLAGHLDCGEDVDFNMDQVTPPTEDSYLLRVWDVYTGRTGCAPVLSAAYNPSGQYIVIASMDKTASIWDATTGQEISELTGHTGAVASAAYSPDGKRIVTTSWDDTARIWDATVGQEIRQPIRHAGGVSSVAYSPDGTLIVTAGCDRSDRFLGCLEGTARIWDAVTGQEIRQFTGHAGSVVSAEYSPNGQYIVTASGDKTARTWDAATGQEIRQLTGHTGGVESAAYSPNGQYIVTASGDKTARIWDAATGQEIRQLTGHTGIIRSAAYSPDGHYIITASSDKTARIWDAATGQEIRQLSGHASGVFSAAYCPDGQHFVTASPDRTARIWDAITGQEIYQLTGHTDWVWSATYSPDGQSIVTTSADKTARIWEAVTGRETGRLTGNAESLTSATYSPDGQFILTGSSDGTARIWIVGIDGLLAKAEHLIQRDPPMLTANEQQQYEVKLGMESIR